MNTFWVTFYSYKGGVGRSMALANVAATLASRGRRVVMVDFDLEAPGLDSFEEFQQGVQRPGVVEYVTSYLENGTPAPLIDYVTEIIPSAPTKDFVLAGKLWLMSSGRRDESYNACRTKIDWTDLYENRRGQEFFENFKAEIEDTYRPDYVLIDSRTGLTDVGGVCTLHLPDLVVLLFALNEQNLQGISSVARVIRGSEREPMILPVATPVPNLEDFVERRLERASELLQENIQITLSYSPEVALRERIFIWRGWEEIVDEYEELENAIRTANPIGIDFLLGAFENAIETREYDRAKDLIITLKDSYPDRVETWVSSAELFEATGDLHGTEKDLHHAVFAFPQSHYAFESLRELFQSQGRTTDLLNLMTEILTANKSIPPRYKGLLLYRTGEILMQFGRNSEAIDYFSEALEFPDNTIQLFHAHEEAFDSNRSEVHIHFCLVEARRRAEGKIVKTEWKRLVEKMEESHRLGYPNGKLAGTHPASIAFACIGDITRARETLRRAERLLRRSSRFLRISSATDFEVHGAEAFADITKSMLEALDRGELWDGMKLG